MPRRPFQSVSDTPHVKRNDFIFHQHSYHANTLFDEFEIKIPKGFDAATELQEKKKRQRDRI